MHSAFLPSKARQTGIALAVSFITVAVPQVRIRPVPRDEWPDWAKQLAQDRQPEDKGIGDTIVHIMGDARSARFKNWFQEKIGINCGCTERQRWLNNKFPYKINSEKV